jgi:SAM-dependent methyltransferase
MEWSYEAWASGEPYNWGGALRGSSKYDAIDFHVDLGCGTVKKGRIGIDHRQAPGVNIIMDLSNGQIHGMATRPGDNANYQSYHAHGFANERWLPFEDGTIESIISHHCLEHIGDGFLTLIDEVYRVLKPGGIFRPITPLFPSRTAVEDPDHRRYFMEKTWDCFCGGLGNADHPTGCWLDSFSVPYTSARFELLDKDITPPVQRDEEWGPNDAREIRVALRAVK